MKILMRPIEMLSWFTKEGVINPIRYRITTEQSEPIVVKVDKVILRTEEKLAGNKMIIFRCQSVINGLQKIYEVKYEISTCKWFLFKM
ncbi:hypothetical protein Desaci_1386 [Desulfosporosinus acidiphilus SJ4]|uniref:Uncharacterized protein n=1 Tax=Desulfosporosinus acidiphilus (strain DSM 22704 / JCM 16185 / SJ4) TaxID=646529 RepID=I4D3N5_DESAJ|nr:hypothetical protein [Desulfosporosinus acidiphilus]AFM40409.1 hypothetical protein Desaci_1386 [Desulfosporosinus acidiphilus SJ4]